MRARRRELRNSLTPAEATLWKFLQRSQLGKKFRRQHGIGRYIVDFCCPECRVIVELDGSPHSSEIVAEYDARRTEDLEKLGFRVLRFENRMVFEHLDSVLAAIRQELE